MELYDQATPAEIVAVIVRSLLVPREKQRTGAAAQTLIFEPSLVGVPPQAAFRRDYVSGAIEIAADVRDRPPLFALAYSPKTPQKTC
jgi:hypothetical protein